MDLINHYLWEKFFFLSLFYLSIAPLLANANNVNDSYHNAILKYKIMTDPLLSHYPVYVTSQQGTVIYVGTVPTDADAEKLIEIAQSIDSVDNVNTANLNIQNPVLNKVDLYILGTVQGLLIRNQIFSQNEIDSGKVKIQVSHGIVVLGGKAEHSWQIDSAKRIAAQVPKVAGVESVMQVGN